MTKLRLKNNLRGDVEDFLSLLLSGRKFKNKIRRIEDDGKALTIEGEIHFERD